MLLYVEGESRYELYGREARGASWARMSSEPVNNDNNNKWIIAHYGKRTCSSIERERERIRILPSGALPKSWFHFRISFLFFVFVFFIFSIWSPSYFALGAAVEYFRFVWLMSTYLKYFRYTYGCTFIWLCMYVVSDFMFQRERLPPIVCMYLGECVQLFGWLRQKRHLPKYRWTFHILFNCPKYFLSNL